MLPLDDKSQNYNKRTNFEIKSLGHDLKKKIQIFQIEDKIIKLKIKVVTWR